MRRPLLLALLLVAPSGCAYFNGMYNAKRLAGSARKADREGRTFEANQYWNQVAVKAESVLVHHPRSKWADEARVLRGTALVRLRDCAKATPPLEQVLDGSRNRDLQERAAMELGECRLRQGDPRLAMAVFARLLESEDRQRRDRARYEHGRALRMSGDPEGALQDLRRTSHPRADGERAAALAALGDLDQAGAIAESLLAARDTLAPWAELLAEFRRRDPGLADSLLHRLAAFENSSPAFRGRLLIQAAEDLAQFDTATSEAYFRRAEGIGADLPVGGEARLARLRNRISRAETVDQLTAPQHELEQMAETPGPYAPAALLLSVLVRRTQLAADSALPGTDRADLRLFAAGELARDSVNAPRLAANLFGRLATEWPESPFAPKALLNVVLLSPADSDSLRQVLSSRYSASPYVLVVQGRGDEAITTLEDSLRRFVAGFRPEGRGGARPGQPAPGAPRPLE